jgi:GTP cyclohydrolase II
VFGVHLIPSIDIRLAVLSASEGLAIRFVALPANPCGRGVGDEVMATSGSLSRYSEANVPTRHGPLRVRVYRDANSTEPIAIIAGKLPDTEGVAVRIHSACFTSETLGCLKCDCRDQLDFAFSYISRNGGVIIYLHQEGRGIGLGDKVRAYALQEQGFDTMEANRLLGLPVDARTYEMAVWMLRDLGITSVRLITNNPSKIAALSKLGIPVVERIPVVIPATRYSEDYLRAKFTLMGHILGEPLPVTTTGDSFGAQATTAAAVATD